MLQFAHFSCKIKIKYNQEVDICLWNSHETNGIFKVISNKMKKAHHFILLVKASSFSKNFGRCNFNTRWLEHSKEWELPLATWIFLMFIVWFKDEKHSTKRKKSKKDKKKKKKKRHKVWKDNVFFVPHFLVCRVTCTFLISRVIQKKMNGLKRIQKVWRMMFLQETFRWLWLHPFYLLLKFHLLVLKTKNL